METRPFPDGGWLLVGASLCGGKSYALLENFFRETVKMVTGKDISAYDSMMAALDESNPIGDIPQVSTLFLGTRQNPHLRGYISHLTDKNFTPQHLIWGFMQGMADELHSMYRGFLTSGGKSPKKMIGSGNGLRKNPHLRKIFEETFALLNLLLIEFKCVKRVHLRIRKWRSVMWKRKFNFRKQIGVSGYVLGGAFFNMLLRFGYCTELSVELPGD